MKSPEVERFFQINPRTQEGSYAYPPPVCPKFEQNFEIIFQDGSVDKYQIQDRETGRTFARFYNARVYGISKWLHYEEDERESDLVLVKNPDLQLSDRVGIMNGLVLAGSFVFAAEPSPRDPQREFRVVRPVRRNTKGRIDYQTEFFQRFNELKTDILPDEIPVWGLR